MSKPIRRVIMRTVVPPLGLGLLRAFGASWRYVLHNERRFLDCINGGRPVVGAFLHARSFPLLYFFSRPGRGRWMLMCSPSRDGDAMAYIEQRLGFRVVRGSSGSGGARALVSLIKAQREDRALGAGLSIDGSRGPRGVAQSGGVVLAQRTGGLILPLAATTARCWVYPRSWDRIVFPKPFAQIHVDCAQPIEVPRNIDDSGIEALRVRLESSVLELNAALDRAVGFPDREPLQVPA